MSQKSNSMLEFQAHICWVITVDYKVRLGQVKSEFDWKRPKLTRSVRASKLSIFSWKYNSVWIKQCSELAGIALVVKLENGPPETSKGQWRPRIFAWLPNFTDLTNGTFFSPTIEFLLKLKRTDETQLDIYNRKLHTKLQIAREGQFNTWNYTIFEDDSR